MVYARKRTYNRRPAQSAFRTLSTIGRAAYGAYRSPLGRAMRGQYQAATRPYVRSAASKRVRVAVVPQRVARPAPAARGRMRGNFRGNFKKPTSFQAGSFLKYGVCQTVEHGLVSSNADCVYVGHSLGNGTLFNIAVSSVIRRLFEKSGASIRTMHEKIQGEGTEHIVTPGDIEWSYRVAAGGTRDLALLVIPANSTYADAVTLLANSILGFTGGSDVAELLEVRYLPSVGVAYFQHASLDLSMSKLHFMCTSAITIQNRTSAASGVADETSALDVANNPVAGKIYRGKGNGAILRSGTNAGFVDGLIGNSVSGQIEFDLANANVSTELALLMKRPPTATLFNHVTKTAPCRLGPGVLKKDFIKFTQSITFNNFVMGMRNTINNPVGDVVRMRFGEFSIFAFEKMCNTQDVSEPVISIGMEINQTYKCRITTGKRGITADHLVV